MKKIYILWTNADMITSENMLFMYATNSRLNRWWDEVTVIIWGATAKLAAENEAIKERIKIAQHAGVKFSACKSCAANLGVIDNLESQGIEVIRWGEKLSNLMQDGTHVLSI